MKTFLGIDFGTTKTAVTMIRESSNYDPEVVEIDGMKTVETALRLDNDDNVLFFGKNALERIHEAAEDTFYNFKAAIGSGKIFRSSNKEYSPETLALIFLKHLRQKIEKKYFNVADLSQVTDLHCTIGCPASWNERQRQVLSELAEKAGFPNVICCDEPFGVIYYYYFRGDLDLTQTQNILVYDFGGGTTDIAIEEISSSPDGSAIGEPRLLAATGIADLGGKDFDEKLRDHFIEGMGATAAALVERDSRTLENYAKLLKENLSMSIEDGVNSVEKVIPMLFSKRTSHKLALSKNEFEHICGPFIERMDEPVYDALNIAAFEADQVNSVILAGGSSRLYYVKNKINALFPNSNILMSANPVEVIGKGLALYGRSRLVKVYNRGKIERADNKKEGNNAGNSERNINLPLKQNFLCFKSKVSAFWKSLSGHVQAKVHDWMTSAERRASTCKYIIEYIKNNIRLCMTILAVIAFLGVGYWFLSPDNISKAWTITESPVKSGSPGANAQYELGLKYEKGDGVTKDLQRAVELYIEAAEQGHAAAQNNLGLMYYSGQGIAQDYAQAVEWYRKAAEQGYAAAQNNLGLMYYTGQGIAQDYAQAAEWYRKAAEQGYAAAQNSLGVMYDEGQGVPQDYAQAVEWYRKAAEQGDSTAQNNLGLMYSAGQGVAQDYDQAYVYFYLSKLYGNTEAQNQLDDLEGKGLFNVRELSEERAEISTRKAQEIYDNQLRNSPNGVE